MNIFDLKRPVSAYELVSILHLSDAEICGNVSYKVNHLAPISHATKGCISFVDLNSFNQTEAIINICDSQASILIIPREIAGLIKTIATSWIIVDHPRKTFIDLINTLAVIPEDYISIGKNCNISDQALIGQTGFGYLINDIFMEPFPQIGYILIEDHVTIQPFVSVNRGSLGTTRIGHHTQINKFVNIGHNDDIGHHCIIQPMVCLNGSISVGDYTWIGGGSVIKDHIEIGNNCIIGIGSVVVNDISDGKTVKGNPAK